MQQGDRDSLILAGTGFAIFVIICVILGGGPCAPSGRNTENENPYIGDPLIDR